MALISADQRRKWQAHRDAIRNCGHCHRPAAAHHGRTGETDMLDVFAALGACTQFVASPAALAQIRRQLRAPKDAPRCEKCSGRGHTGTECPW
jgi:hypothetical protein